MQLENQLPNKRAELGWVMFDWANSAYSLVISTAIFPIYFVTRTSAEIPILGYNISNSSLYAFAVAFAYTLICILAPVLSGIADYGGTRKKFMRLFTTLGSLGCMLLFFFDGNREIWLAIFAFILATSGHAGSLVFYDSYLSQLVPPKRSDKLSARGYAFGYVGSVLLLSFNIFMIQKPELFGLEGTQAYRLSFLSVGLWWLGFSQISFAWLPADTNKDKSTWPFAAGIQALKKAWNHVQLNADLKNYLSAFICYSAGVQTVIYLATAFANKELGFESNQLIVIVLLLQLVAIGGAYLFAAVSKRTNNLKSMTTMLAIWAVICLLAYMVKTQSHFYFIAGMVGLVLGGIQAISRSTYAKLLPKHFDDVTCFFSFYDVLYYVSIVMGTFIFGLIEQVTGDMRNGVLALMCFFIAGIFLLLRVNRAAIRTS